MDADVLVVLGWAAQVGEAAVPGPMTVPKTTVVRS
jgi:hypothetical protein